MKGKRHKQKWNVFRIFVAMVLALVCIGFIVTLRIRHEKTEGDVTDAALHTDFDSKENRIQKIVRNKKYP